MKIQVIIGSDRPGRTSQRVGSWVANVAAEQPGFRVETIDMADYKMPFFDEPISPRYNPNRETNEPARRWLEKIEQADGYVIVTPEYNHSITGVLKNALDYLDSQMQKKPVAIVSYGSVGGARAAEQLKLILLESGAAVVPTALAIIGARDLVNEEGMFEPEAAGKPHGPDAQLVQVLGDLAWWTKTLKAGRAQVART